MNLSDWDTKKLKAIPPAIAGFLADYKAGHKELTATIIDLALRGYLDLANDRLIYAKKTFFGLQPFEEAFLYQNFVRKPVDSLSFEEIKKLYEKETPFIRNIHEQAYRSGFIDANVRKIFFGFYGSALASIGLVLLCAGLLLIGFLPDLAALLKTFFGIEHSGFFLLGGAVLCILLGGYMDWLEWRRIGKKMLQEGVFLTEKGKAMRAYCLDAKKVLESMPLYEDRLANEFVAYAVAFGMGENWMQKLGGKMAVLFSRLEAIKPAEETVAHFLDYT